MVNRNNGTRKVDLERATGLVFRPQTYSARSATVGSTLHARRAGT